MQRLLVGIDLGTTNTTCSISQFQGDLVVPQLESVLIDQLLNDPLSPEPYGHEEILPSLICLKSDGGIYSGRRCRTALPELLSAGYRVIRDTKKQLANPAWYIAYGQTKLRPRHVAALLLTTVHRSILKKYPNGEIVGLVITIPASFSSLMRQETLRAAILAGFDPHRIELLDEPVAALLSALNSDARNSITSGEPLLVFDMGGGTLDATLLTVSAVAKKIQVLATSRYHEVAGNDFDLEIAALVLSKVRKHPDYNSFLEYDENTVQGRIEAANIGLKLLSLSERIKLELGQIISNVKIWGPVEIKRNHFLENHINMLIDFRLDFQDSAVPAKMQVPVADVIDQLAPFINSTASSDRHIFIPVEQVLARANLRDNPKVFLAGGSSYFPFVREALASFFQQTPTMLHPVHAVSHGAVVWAHLRASKAYEIGETLHESIFLRRKGQSFLELFSHPSSIPSDIQEQIFTGDDEVFISTNRKTIRLELYQGSSSLDPQMSLCHIETMNFDRDLPQDSKVLSVKSKIDSDKTFHLTLSVQLGSEIIAGEVAFQYGDLFRNDSHVDSSKLTGLILNGEPI